MDARIADQDRPIVHPVSGKSDIKTFLRAPREIYAGLAGFVPPLDLERASIFVPGKAAFYHDGEAALFLARRQGRVCGRISAQIDRAAIATWGAPIGLFGALDAVDDRSVVASLLDAASDWLRARGMTRMRGPYNLSPSGESGLLVDGQHAAPMVMMPWHPAYLAGHLEALGWTGAKDLLAYELTVGPAAEAALSVPRLRLGGGRVTMRTMRWRTLAADAEIIRSLYNDAWQDNWGFVPLSPFEMKAMIAEMRPVLRRNHVVIVERDGVPVAVALMVPNLFDVVGDLGGAPSPLGWARLAGRIATGRFRSARVILLGVSHAVRGTTLGRMLPSLLIAELMRRGHHLPFRTVELSWILEDNWPMRRLIERLTPTPSKRYRLYERAL